MKVYDRYDPIPIGTKTKIDRQLNNKKSSQTYTVTQIYRTYTNEKQLVGIRYDLEVESTTQGIYGVQHENLVAHIKFTKKQNAKKKYKR